MRSLRFRWWYLLILIPLILVLGFIVWALTPLGPMPEAITALEPSASVDVSTDQWITFTPKDISTDVGIIIYPGGRVDPRSYAPAAHAIAQQGYLVLIVPMPLNLAVLGIDRAEDIIAAFPEINTWIIGGHSLGGSMAANFTDKNREIIDGLYFWAAYPAESDNLSDGVLPVISISASLDGLVSQLDIDDSRNRLPSNTAWIEINGGNHAQFGWYGDQGGDNQATISRKEQQEEIVNAMLKYMEVFR